MRFYVFLLLDIFLIDLKCCIAGIIKAYWESAKTEIPINHSLHVGNLTVQHTPSSLLVQRPYSRMAL